MNFYCAHKMYEKLHKHSTNTYLYLENNVLVTRTPKVRALGFFMPYFTPTITKYIIRHMDVQLYIHPWLMAIYLVNFVNPGGQGSQLECFDALVSEYSIASSYRLHSSRYSSNNQYRENNVGPLAHIYLVIATTHSINPVRPKPRKTSGKTFKRNVEMCFGLQLKYLSDKKICNVKI